MNIPNKIGPFKRYLASPTTLKYGFYYCTKFKLPFHKEERYIRVWLPPNYDFENKNKRFPTIYFSDGQNLVDSYLSAYGEWKFDKVVNKLLKHDGVSCIAVGIDCPKIPRERCNELNPPYPVRSIYARKEGPNHPFADKYIDYIRFNLKPLIDSLFYTKTDKENTGIGGSSMGGIMAFYAYMYAPETFGFSLSFSPAFFLYSKISWQKVMDKYDLNPEKQGKVYLYVGGKNFEEVFVKPTFNTFNFLRKRGFEHDQVRMKYVSNNEHNEKAWAEELYDALRFWLI